MSLGPSPLLPRLSSKWFMQRTFMKLGPHKEKKKSGSQEANLNRFTTTLGRSRLQQLILSYVRAILFMLVVWRQENQIKCHLIKSHDTGKTRTTTCLDSRCVPNPTWLLKNQRVLNKLPASSWERGLYALAKSLSLIPNWQIPQKLQQIPVMNEG